MDEKWLKRTAWSMLSRIPRLSQRVQKNLWRLRARRTYKQRSQDLPRLLGNCSAKRRKNCGPKHIILIVVDCLRKRNLSLYGYHRQTTPFLKSLAQDGAVFENAITAGGWTYPAVASMLSGLYPHNHGGMHTKESLDDLKQDTNFIYKDPTKLLPNKIRQDVLSLPEILAVLGFETHISTAMVPAALSSAGWFKHSSIFDSGCEHHLRGMSNWLRKKKKKRTFAYIHVRDLHQPIKAPMSYRKCFGEIASIPNLDGWEFKEDAQPGEPVFEQYRENRIKLYDCALRFVDAQIARVFECLEKEGIRDSSLVIITADHGEEFWDHVEMEREMFADRRAFFGIAHAHNLFQELINVPLICIGPGITPGRYNHNVSHVDLVPTILEISGIDHNLQLDGRNLFDCSDERFIISEGTPQGYEKKVVLQNNWKLIHSEGDGVSLLFDLSKDPKEECNLAKTNPEKLQELKALLPTEEIKGEALEVDRDIEEQLRNLGYL